MLKTRLKEFKKDYENGCPVKEMAAKYNITERYVSEFARNNGINRGYGDSTLHEMNFPKEKRREIVETYINTDTTYRDIAEMFDTNVCYVSKFIKEAINNGVDVKGLKVRGIDRYKDTIIKRRNDGADFTTIASEVCYNDPYVKMSYYKWVKGK